MTFLPISSMTMCLLKAREASISRSNHHEAKAAALEGSAGPRADPSVDELPASVVRVIFCNFNSGSRCLLKTCQPGFFALGIRRTDMAGLRMLPNAIQFCLSRSDGVRKEAESGSTGGCSQIGSLWSSL